MATLKVSNFGPIKELDWEVEDYCLFIGPPASGKSTIAKLLYYFLTIDESISQYLGGLYISSPHALDTGEEVQRCIKTLKKKFIDFFGSTKEMQPFSISYSDDAARKIKIELKGGYPELLFSEGYNLEEMFKQIQEIPLSERFFTTSAFLKEWLMKDLELSSNIIYIPAGRSILSYYELSPAEPTLSFFFDRIKGIKGHFNQSFDEIIKDWENLHTSKIDKASLSHAIGLIRKILKGEYRYIDREDRLYYNETDYVKLSLASSGQQEAVWILQLIFFLILDNTKATLLIEEPEAHLFPEAQMYMVRLISLFARLNGNRVIITTHSPYILTTINNLLYASKIGAKHPEEANETIPSYCWIDYAKVGSYYISGGRLESLLEDDIKQIRAEKIDEISSVLNEQFDELLNLYDDEV
ncbi:hypothetical protein FACS1894181_03050 [Bacteroidia bacterium]|nr:hypothetical protein FACS1894181_03050 [Bacteroidia bacterium]